MKLHNYSLQLTPGLKPPLQRLFWKCSEEKECSKILKIPKHLCKIGLSSLRRQACSFEFPALTKQTSTKMFPVSVLK